jgi:hypothetical protein
VREPAERRATSATPAWTRRLLDVTIGPRAELPAGLVSGVRSLSGVDLSGVRVHRNSGRPAELDALAYTRGPEIHLGPGQERQLPHEAWHVVQQAQGRVDPSGGPVNDDAGLEREADVMGARALRGAPGQAAPASPVSAQPPVTQLQKSKGQKNRAKRRRQREQEDERREAAIDRLERGGEPDPLDQLQPRKTAARKNIEAHAQRLREARLPPTDVVEVGAGEGRFSGPFSRKFGDNYAATDIARRQGTEGFLGSTRNVGRRYGVNANQLGSHVLPGSLSHVVAANPFGVKGVGGASFGLRKQNPGGTGSNKWQPDPRFLTTARPLLKPGGSVELYGRSNILRENAVAQVTKTGKKGSRTADEQRRVAEAKQKFSGENANPYLEIGPGGLQQLAKQTGYRVNVKRAKQPAGTAQGGNPDTIHSDAQRAQTGLKPFNTRFSFTPEEDGYQSDAEDPRVVYDSGDESDWED